MGLNLIVPEELQMEVCDIVQETLIPSAQRFVWAAKQPLGGAALGALFA